jgi:hypothetical protein
MRSIREGAGERTAEKRCPARVSWSCAQDGREPCDGPRKDRLECASDVRNGVNRVAFLLSGSKIARRLPSGDSARTREAACERRWDSRRESRAASAASTICATKTLSRLCGRGDLGGIDDILTEGVAEAGRRMEVHFASEELGELALQIDELEEADPRIGGELDQHVDVALEAEVLAKDGAEEGETTNAGAPAEGSWSPRVYIDLQAHCSSSSPEARASRRPHRTSARAARSYSVDEGVPVLARMQRSASRG